jgi:hypothetical protein
MICFVDHSEHPDQAALHRHLRRLKLTQEQYYTTYFPRYDLATGEPIPFKTLGQYLTTEFLTRDNLRRWIQANPEKGREWAIEFLRNRKIEKTLVHPPTQVELESLLCPSIHYYETIGGYHAICCELGYQVRFDGDLARLSEPVGLPAEAVIIRDTREQTPLDLSHRTISRKLSAGDYALEGRHDLGVYIERKTVSDWAGTLSDRKIERQLGNDSNLDRFTRELERAGEVGSYVIMLVEAPLRDALDFRRLPPFARNWTQRQNLKTGKWEGRYVGATPEHIWHNFRDLLVRFPHFQALFVRNRDEAARAVVKLLALGETVKNVDLQYAYETRKLVF